MYRKIRRRNHLVGPAFAVVLGAVALTVLLAGCGQSSGGGKASAAKPAVTSKPAGGQQAAGAAQGASGQSVAASTFTGTIEYVEGDVTVNGAATEIGAQVKNGDTITTGNSGVCDIVFLKRNIVQIQADSIAVLNFGEIGRGIQLESGALAAVLKNLTPTKTGNRFQVDTPTIVAGVRGTTFYIKVLNINSTYFCLCNGEVHLQDSAGGDKMALEAAHHSAVEYNREDGIFRVTKRPLLYHTDAEMQALASKIGYTINWKKPDLVN